MIFRREFTVRTSLANTALLFTRFLDKILSLPAPHRFLQKRRLNSWLGSFHALVFIARKIQNTCFTIKMFKL